MLTQFSTAPPNGGSVWVRVVDEASGAVFEQEITADLPANTQFLSPRLFMNNGTKAAAVRGGSVDLNRFRALCKWFSASVMPLPLRVSAG